MKFILIFALVSFNIFTSENTFFTLQRSQRPVNAHTIKSAVAEFDESKPIKIQGRNGDEQRFSDLRGSFGKALNHFSTGFIIPAAFNSLVFALQSESFQAFNQIQLGEGRKLVNPQGSLVYSLGGNDGWINIIPPAPSFTSAQTAGEMVEVYWTALARDIPFNEFSTNPITLAAIADLNTLTDFRGPKINGQVTPQTFLRGNTPGDLVGPYISQFLYLTIPYGSTEIPPEQRVPLQGPVNDFNTTFADWFTTIDGGDTGNIITYDDEKHFLRTPRDLTEYVHQDTPGQEILNAALILNFFGEEALNPTCPYFNNPTQYGFVTFGVADILYLIRVAVEEGLKAAWYQKWIVNRRLRPEEYGFYVQLQKSGEMNLGINEQLINSPVLPLIADNYDETFFLPVAYPEGSPTHPAYPAGHATFIGAGVTILKALFNENFVIPNPVAPNENNDALIPLDMELTVGGELNKLAANISLGRDHAGVHYRSDGAEGMNLGEEVAINVLNNQSFLFNENFSGYTFTRFDGTKVTVGQKRQI